MPGLVQLLVNALVIGWLVALVDAWWRLQRVILELHQLVSQLAEPESDDGHVNGL